MLECSWRSARHFPLGFFGSCSPNTIYFDRLYLVRCARTRSCTRSWVRVTPLPGTMTAVTASIQCGCGTPNRDLPGDEGGAKFGRGLVTR
jgi:hypothetical protein